MEKTYSRINWENFPSVATPINERNLNKVDEALNEVDNRVLGLDTVKLDKSTANKLVKNVDFNEKTGIFTITFLDETTKNLDTKLEKLAINFRFDYETQKLILTLVDGTEQSIDLSALLTQYEFTVSDTIALTVDSSGKVSATVKNGSITGDMLEPNYLADIKVETASSLANKQASETASNLSNEYALLSKSYAHGDSGVREGEDSDNAKYYYNQTKQISQGLNGIVPMGTVTFATLPTEDIVKNAMYNVSDAFTSDERFNDGGGIYYGPGNNVIWTAEGKWDVTASSNVTGIKGDAEDTYRQGNVNITAENIGLGNVDNTSDADKPISTAQQEAFDGINTELRYLRAPSVANGIDVIDYFENTAPKGVSVLHLTNPVNGYNTTQSWFTFYKASNQFGRIEQRNINSDQIFVKCISGGTWYNWDRYSKNSEVAPIGTQYHNAPLDSIALDGTTLKELCSIAIPKGTYLLIGKVGFSATFTDVYLGYRLANGSEVSVVYETSISERAVTLIKAITLAQDVTLYLKARGTGTVTIDNRLNFLQAVRLK